MLLLYAYYILVALFVLQAFTIKNISPKIQILLIITALSLLLVMPFCLNISYGVVMTGSDQSYDLSLVRKVVHDGQLQSSVGMLNGRSGEYAYFPALHVFSAIIMLFTALPDLVVMVIPTLINFFLCFALFYAISKPNVRFAGLLVILSITLGYGFFHIQFVRETYSSVVETLLLFLLLIYLARRTDALTSRVVIIVSSIILITISLSHFYLQFILLCSLAFLLIISKFLRKTDFGKESNTQILDRESQRIIRVLFLLGLLIFLAYDTIVASGYVVFQDFPSFASNIGHLLSIIVDPTTISTGLNSVGSQQVSFFEKYLIFLQVGGLLVYTLTVIILMLRRSRINKKALIPMFVGLIFYLAALTLRFSPNYFMNQASLRASGVILFFLLLYLIFLSNYINQKVLLKVFKVTLILVLISIVCFPALIGPAYKDSSLSYEIPAQAAKTINDYYPTSPLLTSYVYTGGASLIPPDSFTSFDCYLEVPRYINCLQNFSNANPNSIVFIDQQFFSQLNNSTVINVNGQVFTYHVFFSSPQLQLIYIDP